MMPGILIVDESPTYRGTVKSILNKKFPCISIREAGDSTEGLEAVKRFAPKLVLINIHLEGENGLELVGRIKRLQPGCFIIVTTDFNFPEYQEAALKSGGDRFIPKDLLSGEQIMALTDSIFDEAGRIRA